jgi:hypothetical protein
MAEMEVFGTERDDIQGSKFQKYQGIEGQTDRVAIIPFEGKKYFKGAKTHFKDRIFLCKSTPQKKEICCTHSYAGNNPEYRMAGVVVIYDLAMKDGKPKLKGYQLLPWFFKATMYQKLVKADQEFPLDSHDIKLTCRNKEFQTIDVQSCKDCIWVSNPELKKKILEEAAPIFEQIPRGIGADLGITEIHEQLGIDNPGAEDAATNIDLGTVIDTIE